MDDSTDQEVQPCAPEVLHETEMRVDKHYNVSAASF